MSSSKNGVVLRIQGSIYDRAPLWIYYLTTYYFRNKICIIDVQLGYIQAFENIEIFKVKLRWRKSSRLSQGIAFLVLLEMRHKFS